MVQGGARKESLSSLSISRIMSKFLDMDPENLDRISFLLTGDGCAVGETLYIRRRCLYFLYVLLIHVLVRHHTVGASP
jgi:hypothetical protein